MTARRHTLPRKNILRGKRAFEYVFEHGSSFRVGVLKFLFCTNVPEELVQSPVSVAFAAPKRLFKRAVDRNYIKRRMREAYRLNQDIIDLPAGQPSQEPIVLFVIYQKPRKLPYAAIRKDMNAGLRELQKRVYGVH